MLADRLKLRHLRCFLAIFRSGSISGASEVLSLSQPTVTKTLKELECILGSRLIDRGRGTAKLTIQGEVFMPRAVACLKELDRAVESVMAADSKMEWHIHVGTMPSTETSLVPSAVSIVQQDVPAAVVRISTGPLKYLATMLLDDQIDLVVGHMPALEPDGGANVRASLYRAVPVCRTKRPSACRRGDPAMLARLDSST